MFLGLVHRLAEIVALKIGADIGMGAAGMAVDLQRTLQDRAGFRNTHQGGGIALAQAGAVFQKRVGNDQDLVAEVVEGQHRIIKAEGSQRDIQRRVLFRQPFQQTDAVVTKKTHHPPGKAGQVRRRTKRYLLNFSCRKVKMSLSISRDAPPL